MSEKCVVGIDFGTDSCRALIVDASTGAEVGSGVSRYARWAQGLYCDAAANRYRQHPQDYVDSLVEAVRNALSQAGAPVAGAIAGICIDTTGSTPALIGRDGNPLALSPHFAEDPDAMFILWKDHTAVREAEMINQLARSWESDYTLFSGGTYSSEWAWAKVLHVLKTNPAVRDAAYSWAEHCDWMTGLLTGNTRPQEMMRSRCAAGHKAMWHAQWGGLPDAGFLSRLDPALGAMRPYLYDQTHASDTAAGKLTTVWAERLGLPAGITVAVGTLDAHAGAVGAGVAPGILTRIIGTSTCDIMVADQQQLGNQCIGGICGQVDGSVLPGYIGLEAGQSAFGDIYAWFRQVMAWSLDLLPESAEKQSAFNSILPTLTAQAEKLPTDVTAPIALDWMNGRRTPDADQNVRGVLSGLTLGTTAPAIFKALVEGTAFGSKRIVEHLRQNGIEINAVHAIGGISKKSPFVMQILSDVLDMPIRVVASEQACALGSAMYASVAAGIHPSMGEAREAMGSTFEARYTPRPEFAEVYRLLYEKYLFTAGYANELK